MSSDLSPKPSCFSRGAGFISQGVKLTAREKCSLLSSARRSQIVRRASFSSLAGTDSSSPISQVNVPASKKVSPSFESRSVTLSSVTGLFTASAGSAPTYSAKR